VALDITLFILRILSGALLLAMFTALIVVLWRDYRLTATQTQASKRSYGKLSHLLQLDEMYVPTGDSHALRPLTSFGRSPTNSVVLDDSFTSSEHATITLRDGQWWLEDRNSRNGTLLNGEPIEMPVIITDGDILSVGQSHFRLDLED
jgi:hypothetical protein